MEDLYAVVLIKKNKLKIEMTNSKKIFFSVVLVSFLILVGTTYAQKYSSEFLSIGVGARALAMGGAYVAISNDGAAVYWNPAGLSQIKKREVSFMHASRFSGLVHVNFIGFVFPDKNGNAFGISYFRMGIDDIPKSTKLDQFDRPVIEGYMQDTEHALFLSFSHRLTNKFFIGGNLKTIRQAVGSNSSMGFGFDLGALYRISNSFSVGMNLQDIAGTYVYWDTGHKDVRKPTLKWGFALSNPVPFLARRATLAVNQNICFEGENSENNFSFGEIAGSDFQFGGEIMLINLLALRVGMERENFTAGTGFRLKFFQIDYAFVSYDLGNTHRISGRILF